MHKAGFIGGVPIEQWDPDEYLETMRGRAAAAEAAVEEAAAEKAARDRHLKFGHSIEGDTETIWKKGVYAKRMIHGVATTPTVSSNNQSLSSKGMKARVPIPILSQHEGTGTSIGEVFLIRKRPTDIYIAARIFENEPGDHAWRLIENKEVSCLSVGPSDGHLQGVVDGIKYFDRWTLSEVSICRLGANPDCVFEILNQGGRPPYPDSLLGMAGKKQRYAAGKL